MYKSSQFRLIPSAEVDRVMARLQAIDLTQPLSPAELADFNSSKAREMARAEFRRLPSPQSESHYKCLWMALDGTISPSNICVENDFYSRRQQGSWNEQDFYKAV